MRRLIVVRPQPGASETVARAGRLGIEALAMPLFGVGVVKATPPSPTGYDALLLTSANAVRHGGAALAAVATLPVMAVGAATADAARAAGLSVTRSGSGDVAALLADLPTELRLLHLAGADHRTVDALQSIDRIIVYESVALPFPAAVPDLADTVIALHSPRAAMRFAELTEHHGSERRRISLVALSPAIAAAAGSGWRHIATAPRPTDHGLLALAAELCLNAAE